MSARNVMWLALTLGGEVLSVGCNTSQPAEPETVPSVPVSSIPGHGSLTEDTTPKETQRLVPAETLIRSYLSLFGGLAPLDMQARLRGPSNSSALFDTWNDYLASLGLPDYRVDIPRGTQTNALMIATFERVGVALCDRAMEHDLPRTGTRPAVAQRYIFAFDPADGALTQATFAAGFDVLHRTFLAYPATLAPPSRVGRFFQLYSDVVAHRMGPDAGSSQFTPQQAGWAAVCYGLIRHPEFHLY